MAAGSGKGGDRQIVLLLRAAEQGDELRPIAYRIEPFVGREQWIAAEARRCRALQGRDGILCRPGMGQYTPEIVDAFGIGEFVSRAAPG